MSPWLWAFLLFALITIIERFVLNQPHNKLPAEEILERRKWYTSIFTAGVVSLLINLRWQQGAVDDTSPLSQYMSPLFTLGLFLIALSLVRSRSLPTSNKIDIAETAASEPVSGSTGPKLNRKRAGMLLLSLLLVVAAIWAAGSEDLTRLPAFIPVVLWLTAIFLRFAAGWDNTGWNKPSGKTVLITSSLFLFALLARVSYLAEIPNPMYGDEGSFSFSAVEFITGESNNIFTTSWFRFPSLYFFLQSIPIRLFGNTVFAPRLLSGLVGSLSVVAVYFLGRQMFNARIGLIAAILLAASPLHIEFSRIAINNIWDSLSFALVLGSLWYAWKHKKSNAFLLAGFFLGIGQYFYVTGRLLLVFVPLWLFMLARREGSGWRQRVPGLVNGAAVAVVTALPIAWYYLTHPDEYFRVVTRVSIWETEALFNFDALWNSLSRGFLAYTHFGLKEFYESGEPVLRLWPALFFILGILFLIQKRHSLRFGILASWLLVLSIAAGLSTNSPAAQRLITATPAVTLIVAFGLFATLDYLKNHWPQMKRFSLTILIVLTAWIAVDDLRFYYLEHTPKWDNGLTSEVSFRLGLYTQDLPSDSQIILFTFPTMGYENLLALRYLAPQVEGINMENTWGSADNPEISGDHLLFVFTSLHEDSLKAVQEDYPQGKLIHETYRNDATVYWLYEVGIPSQ